MTSDAMVPDALHRLRELSERWHSEAGASPHIEDCALELDAALATVSGEDAERCSWPTCTEPALCRSGNFGDQLVCSEHFRVTNGSADGRVPEPPKENHDEQAATSESHCQATVVTDDPARALPTLGSANQVAGTFTAEARAPHEPPADELTTAQQMHILVAETRRCIVDGYINQVHRKLDALDDLIREAHASRPAPPLD